jgi:GAF domain-containing protein
MTALRVFFPEINVWLEMFVDASALTIFIFPSLYFFMLKPMQREIAAHEIAKEKQQAAHSDLQDLTQSLESRVVERTKEAEAQQLNAQKRSQQFETIVRVSKAISSAKNLHKALPQIALTISEQFGFYHVGVFLNDATNQYAILSAANSEGGKKMLARGHQLKIGAQGIVGYVTETGKPRIALDVGEDAVYFNNPDMPLTRSEMALPLTDGSNVIGALDIQSVEANAFTPEDVESLTALADQVSLVIQNARLFSQTEKTLLETEAIQRQYLRETWSRLPKEENFAGVRYSILGASIIAADEIMPTDKKQTEITVPIVLRGEAIGELSVQAPPHKRVTSDQMDLIKAVAERVALSAENARLFGETSRRAERERVISDIASKMGNSVRTESILQTTAKELSQFLEGADIIIKLESPNNKEAPNG